MNHQGSPSAQSPGPVAPQVPQGAPQASKGFPWGKVLMGCGCLSLVGVIAAVVVGFFAYKAGSTYLEEFAEDFGLVAEATETAKSAGKTTTKKGASKSATASGDRGERAAKSDSNAALEAEKIRGYLEKPLTAAEVREFNRFVESWRKNPAFVRWEKETQGLEDFGKRIQGKDTTSVADKLRGARQAGRTMTAMSELIEAFDEHIQKNGGYEKHYSRTMRISGLQLAAETIAGSHKNDDPHSNAVSKLMLKERPEIAKEYKEAIEEARAASKRAKNKDAKNVAGYQAMMAIMGGGPGTIALARMPAQSFRTWDAMSPGDRKKLQENLTTAFGAASWFGAGLHPGALFSAAYAAEMEQFK